MSREEAIATLVSVSHSSTRFSGPIPPPAMLKEYDDLLPGAADRILKMAENQQSHRLVLEKEAVTSELFRSKLGMLCGFVVALAGIGAGVAIALVGGTDVAKVAGGVVSGTTLLGMVGTFVYATSEKRKERTEKTRVLAGAAYQGDPKDKID